MLLSDFVFFLMEARVVIEAWFILVEVLLHHLAKTGHGSSYRRQFSDFVLCL